MALTGCDKQDGEVAFRPKGDETVELLAGSITLTPPAEDAEVAIFRAISVLQAAP